MTINHTETDKEFEKKFHLTGDEDGDAYYFSPDGREVKSFLHHRIELEVEKAVSKNKKYIGKLLSMISTKQQLLDLIDSLNK